MRVIQVPMREMLWPVKKRRKLRWRRARQAWEKRLAVSSAVEDGLWLIDVSGFAICVKSYWRVALGSDAENDFVASCEWWSEDNLDEGIGLSNSCIKIRA